MRCASALSSAFVLRSTPLALARDDEADEEEEDDDAAVGVDALYY